METSGNTKSRSIPIKYPKGMSAQAYVRKQTSTSPTEQPIRKPNIQRKVRIPKSDNMIFEMTI